MNRVRRAVARYDGHVQGVGFRFTAIGISQGYNVTGYVQNLPDGSVELMAEGEEEQVNSFLARIRTSQVGRYITHEDLSWEDPTQEFDSFTVRY